MTHVTGSPPIPLKVAITFPGCHRRGGVERVMLECVNFMASRGHEVHALAADWDQSPPAPGVVRHHLRVPGAVRALILPLFKWRATRAIRRLDPPPDVVASFGVAAPDGSVVWMQSVHGAWLEISRAARSWPGRAKQLLNPFHHVTLHMERNQLRNRRYARLIALTPQVKSDIQRLYGVPAGDIVVIPNGYAASEFHVPTPKRRARVRSELGYERTDRVIVFVANEFERKGWQFLIRAVAELDDPRVRVLAVGRLNQAAARPELVRLGIEERVTFTGPADDVARYYAASDYFVLPTMYEAWGLVIIEAMACGLPVVTTRLAGASTAVAEGQTGYILDDPSDHSAISAALRRLLAGEHSSPIFVSESVRGYEWSKVLRRYEEVLRTAAT